MGLVAERTPPTDDSRYALAPDTSLGRLRQGRAGIEFECGDFGLSSCRVVESRCSSLGARLPGSATSPLAFHASRRAAMRAAIVIHKAKSSHFC